MLSKVMDNTVGRQLVTVYVTTYSLVNESWKCRVLFDKKDAIVEKTYILRRFTKPNNAARLICDADNIFVWNFY